MMKAYVLVALLLLTACELSFSGELPKYMNPVDCPDPAKTVIFKERMRAVHECVSESVTFGSGKASLVTLSLGPASNCYKGCDYVIQQYIVENDERYYLVDVPTGSQADKLMEDYVWQTLGVPMADLDDVDSRSLVQYGDGLAMQYTFKQHVRGTLYVLGNDRIEGDIKLRTFSMHSAMEKAVQQLDEGFMLSSQPLFVPSLDHKGGCWEFLYHKEIAQCEVNVCLDGFTTTRCT